MAQENTHDHPHGHPHDQGGQSGKAKHLPLSLQVIGVVAAAAYILADVSGHWDDWWMKYGLVWAFALGICYLMYGVMHERFLWSVPHSLSVSSIVFVLFAFGIIVAYSGTGMPRFLRSPKLRFALPIFLIVLVITSRVRALRKSRPTIVTPPADGTPSTAPQSQHATTFPSTASLLPDLAHAQPERPDVPTKLIDGRIIVNVSPDELVGYFHQHMGIQAQKLVAPFIGKWMRVSGPLGDLTDRTQWITMEFASTGQKFSFVMRFKPEWKDRLEILKHGDQITLLGKIAEVEGHWCALIDCELLA